MQNNKLIIELIEDNFKLNELKYRQFNIWPYLRGVYGSYTLFLQREFKAGNTGLNKIKKLKYLFHGIGYLFKKYDYFIFSDTDSLKLMDTKYIDRMAHGLIEKLGIDNCLYIETLNKDYTYTSKHILYKRLTDLILLIFGFLIYFITFKKNFDSNILNQINLNYKLKVNYSNACHHFNSFYKVYKWFFKIKKPKYIFVTCFTKRALIKAANDLRIPTIEFQHGIINNNYAYNLPLGSDLSYCPKYLLVFGDKDKEIINNYNYLINKSNVHSIGNYYLSNIVNSKIKIDIPNYKFKFIVSLQSPVAKQMLEFINEIANIKLDFLFVLVPRVSNDLESYVRKQNVITLEQYSCYEVASIADIHISAYSSCVYEAPALGIPNIFYNIKNLSEYYYSDFINSKSYNKLINNVSEFINFIDNYKLPNKTIVAEEHKDYFNNQDNNLNYFLNEIGLN